ncbi:uncharacterized protein LOC135400907 [Ornithodoros turicata]|uniref:uncharacterized protein LOC135400907 n=1 Tax=Ornithodoros turicata TaxID=34597 RepID=UPI003139AC33
MSTVRLICPYVIIAFCSGCLASAGHIKPAPEAAHATAIAKEQFPVTIDVSHEVQLGRQLPVTSVTWKTNSSISMSLDQFYIIVCNPNKVCHIYNTTRNILRPTGLQYWTAYTIDVIGIYNVNGSLRIGGVGRDTVYTGEGAPFPPASVRADFAFPATIIVSWANPKSTSSRDITSYDVCVTLPTNGKCAYSRLVPFGRNGYQIKFENLPFATTYKISVKSVISDTRQGASSNFTSEPETTSVTIPAQGYLPTKNLAYRLDPRNGSVDVTLTWDVEPSGGVSPSRFLFKVCDGDACSSHEAAGAQELTLKDIDHWKTLKVSGYAVYDLNGAIILSEEQKTVVKTGPGKPRSPSAITAVALGPTSVLLSWMYSGSGEKTPTEYVIEVCKDKVECTKNRHVQTKRTVNTAVIRDLTAETNYMLRIHAVITDGSKTYSGIADEVAVTTPGYENKPPIFHWKNPVHNDSVITGCTISVLRNHSTIVFNITTTSESGALARLIPWTNYEEQKLGCEERHEDFEKTAIAVGVAEMNRQSPPFSLPSPTVIFICVIAIVTGISIIGYLTYRKLHSNKKVSVLQDAEEMDTRSDEHDPTPVAWKTNFLFHDR